MLLQIERVSLFFCEHYLLNYRELPLHFYHLVDVEEFEQLLFSELNQLALTRPATAHCRVHESKCWSPSSKQFLDVT